MIHSPKADQDKELFVKSVEAMLDRLKEIEDRFPEDEEGLNHHTIREIQYWFRMSGEVNPHF